MPFTASAFGSSVVVMLHVTRAEKVPSAPMNVDHMEGQDCPAKKPGSSTKEPESENAPTLTGYLRRRWC
jgi:hypothetical protein